MSAASNFGIPMRVCFLALISQFFILSALAAPPPSSPGLPHQWAPALKQAVGTAYEPVAAASPVWFTLAQGVVTEVFYPNADFPQIGELQLVVTDGDRFFSEQKRDTISTVRYKDEGMVVQVSGKDRSGRYSYEQEIFTDVAAPALRIRTRFKAATSGLRVFVLFKPALDNNGSRNIGSALKTGLFASGASPTQVRAGGPTHAALIASVPWGTTSAGFLGSSDGWMDLFQNSRLTQSQKEAGPGNIVLSGELLLKSENTSEFELALGFGQTQAAALTYASTAIQFPFEKARSQYESGWNQYLKSLTSAGSPFSRRSAQIIKMHEDKRRRGAIVSSLSNPAIPEGKQASDGGGGYHLVRPRDAYHAAMALLAAGDSKTPRDVLRYFVQTQSGDGSWPQSLWIDGTPDWKAIQMDQIAFPILLAGHLRARLGISLSEDELEMVRKATTYLISRGPRTEVDRWDEAQGYSPSTLAVEVSALRTAAALTGDSIPRTAAEEWQIQIERWTMVTEGPLGKNYYLRVSPTGEPSQREGVDLAHGAGASFAWEILDGGFLELVRQGIRDADDPRIRGTLRIYESETSGLGEKGSFHRYTKDAYGPGRSGGFWPVLAGERGHYAVAAKDFEQARVQLHLLERSALPSGLLPEQVIQPSPSLRVGLGVASPHVWAHAEGVLLNRSIEEGKVFDAPPFIRSTGDEQSPFSR